MDGEQRAAPGGDHEPLLTSVTALAELRLLDDVDSVFASVNQELRIERPHPGFDVGECHGESAVEIRRALNERDELEDEEPYQNEAGELVPFDDLSEQEQQYYSDPEIDESKTTLADYCASLRAKVASGEDSPA